MDKKMYGMTMAILCLTVIFLAVSPTQSFASDYQLIVNPGGKEALLAELQKAKYSIDLVIYELDDVNTTPALPATVEYMLATKQTEGVKIRVIINDFIGEKFPPQSAGVGYENHAINFLNQCNERNIEIVFPQLEYQKSSPAFAVTHEKTFIIDAGYPTAEAIVMSFNLVADAATHTDYFANTRDFGIVTTNPQEVNLIEAIFNQDWYINCPLKQKTTPALPPDTSLVVSPVNSKDGLLNLINSATQSIDMYMEEFGDSDIQTALINQATKIPVRIIASNMSVNQYLATQINQTANGKMFEVDSSQSPYVYIHAKMILVDGGKAYVGSENASLASLTENASLASLTENREMGIIVNDSGVIGQLQGTFDSDWSIYSNQ